MSPQLRTFLMTPGMVTLVATDVFGHSYSLDLFDELRAFNSSPNSKLLRFGDAAIQVRTYGTMLPNTNQVGAPNGALSHLFGAHSYVTVWEGGDTVSLDLRVVNGFSNEDNTTTIDDPLGKVYFRSLELRLPASWTMLQDVNDPMLGHPYQVGQWMMFPIVRPNTDGTLHVMPHQAQFQRRLALTPVGTQAQAQHILDEAGLGFVRRGPSPTGGELYSWWNPATARYFPQKHKLPKFDHMTPNEILQKINGDYWNARNALESGQPGNWPLDAARMGWAHPWGIPYGGMAGGYEIWLYDGLFTAEISSNRGYKAAQMISRMYQDRQPTAIFNRTGEHTSVDDWTIQGPNFDYVHMNFFLKLLSGPDPFGFGNAPTFQVNQVANSGVKPGYENALLAYKPIDFQHYVRMTRTPKILAWLGNDALAKDDLKHAAEIFHLSYHDLHTSPNGAIIGSGLLANVNYTTNNPGKGFGFGRGRAWGLDTAVAAFSLGDVQWRNRHRGWLSKIGDTVANGQIPCSGFVQAQVNSHWLGGAFKARSSVEQAITENALWGLKESVFRGNDNGRYAQTNAVIRDYAYAMIGPMAWSSSAGAPHSYVAVASKDTHQPYCGSVPAGGLGGGTDSYQTWNSFAYGFEITGDPLFLQRATDMTGTSNLLNWLMGETFKNRWNRAALLALLQ